MSEQTEKTPVSGAGGPEPPMPLAAPFNPFPDGIPPDIPAVTDAVRADWPGRYYASYRVDAPQPTPVTGWWDVWSMSDLSGLPDRAGMLALTDAEWADRLPFGSGVQAGRIVACTPPPVPVPLPVQAEAELRWVQSEATLAAAMGERFTDAMRAYVGVIRTIANGTDTTRTALPPRPDPVTA